LIEDFNLRQPEMIFSVVSKRTRAEIEAKLDAAEHGSVRAFEATRENVEATIADVDVLTPIAVASLVLWGRIQFGQTWFEQIAANTLSHRIA